MNTEDKGDLFVERTPDGDFLVKVEDLKQMGLTDPQGTEVVVDGENYVSLRSMHGISFVFLEKTLTLDLVADPKLLPIHSLAAAARRKNPIGAIPQGSSAFFNYALDVSRTTGAPGRVDVSTELGWRVGDYLLLSTANTRQDPEARGKFVRLMTSATRDDRDNMRRLVIGDFFTPSRDFGAGISLGGVSVSKLYGLNPYFVKFPTQTVGGTVAVPTDMDVYLDGQRIRSERLQPGQFQLTDITAYGGERNVQVVLRDAFGRVQTLDYSFYFTDQPLRRGLHEYSYGLGFMRRQYALESNHYGPVALSLFHRYGVTDRYTVGMRAEAAHHFVNAGPSASMVLPGAGVFNAALAATNVAGRRGSSALLSYSYQRKRWSVGMSVRRDSREYAALGDPPLMTNRKYEANAVASVYLPHGAMASISQTLVTTRAGLVTLPSVARPFNTVALSDSRVTALAYSMPLGAGRTMLAASLAHIKGRERTRNEVFVGLTMFFESAYSAAVSYRGNNTGSIEQFQLVKNQPIGEGLGFILSGNRTSGSNDQTVQLNSTVQYNAPIALLRADLGRSRDGSGSSTDNYRFSLAGGVGLAGSHLALGRPIMDSFGLVKVGDLPGVGVSVNGQVVGKTDRNGQVFVPTLTPYFDNTISIATEDIPMDFAVPSARKTVSPLLRSGALVEFRVKKIRAFTGKIRARQGPKLAPVEFQEITIEIDGKSRKLETGRGGQFYFEDVKPGTYKATARVDGRPCTFDLVVPNSEEALSELGDFTCRPSF